MVAGCLRPNFLKKSRLKSQLPQEILQKLQTKESAQPEDAGDVKKLLLYLLDKN